MIAEPWDIGPGGYQLGNFPDNWLEWNDRYRDDVRRFWRGDGRHLGHVGHAHERIGPTYFRQADPQCQFPRRRMMAFTLADTVAYAERAQ